MRDNAYLLNQIGLPFGLPGQAQELPPTGLHRRQADRQEHLATFVEPVGRIQALGGHRHQVLILLDDDATSAGAQSCDRCLQGSRGTVNHEGTGWAVVVDDVAQVVDVHFPAIVLDFGLAGLVNAQDRPGPSQEEATWEQRRVCDDVVGGLVVALGEPIEVLVCGCKW